MSHRAQALVTCKLGGKPERGKGNTMEQTATIAYWEGQLVVIPDKWEAAYSKPAEFRHYWPLGISAQPDDDRIGIHGLLTIDGLQAPRDTWYLAGGRETRPVYTDYRVVKKPRDSKHYSWEWAYGKWVKRYK